MEKNVNAGAGGEGKKEQQRSLRAFFTTKKRQLETDLQAKCPKNARRTSFEPNRAWGALVDQVWGKECDACEAEAKVNALEMRYRKWKKQKPFAPTFMRGMVSILEQPFRPPGAGVYSFDQIRKNRYSRRDIMEMQSSLAPIAQIHNKNLFRVLSEFVRVQTLELGELRSVDEHVLLAQQLLLFGESSNSFKTVSALFYARHWWVTSETLMKVWGVDSSDYPHASIQEYVLSAPAGLTDALDRLSVARREQLVSLQSANVNRSCEKRTLLHKVAQWGLKSAMQMVEELQEPAQRLRDDTYEMLYECHVWLFARQGYGPEDTKILLSTDLEQFKFPGDDVKSGTAMQALPQDTVQTLSKLEDRERFFQAVAHWANLDIEVALGDGSQAYLSVHKASTRLLQLVESTCSEIRLDEIKFLVKTCFVGCNLLEREKRYEEAVHYLKSVQEATKSNPSLAQLHCEAVSRLAIDQEHLKCKTEALLLVESLLTTHRQYLLDCVLQPSDGTINRAGEMGIGLIKHCLKLSVPPRRWRVAIAGIESIPEPPSITIHIAKVKSPSDPSQLQWPGKNGVEGAALDVLLSNLRLEDPSWTGSHCENGFLASLFMVLMWDIIFDPGRLSWSNQWPFIEIPTDVLDGSWTSCKNTRALIQERLNFIRSDDTLEYTTSLIRSSWDKHEGTHARGMNWHRNTMTEMLGIASGLGKESLAMICACFCENYICWSGGLPDLMLWRLHPPSAKLVEIKGPGDSLSNRQRAWLHKLVSAGTDIVVCYVVEQT